MHEVRTLEMNRLAANSWRCLVLALAWCCLHASPALAQEGADAYELDEEALYFDDQPQRRDTELPDWFKLSFLDLPQDLEEANEAGKRGLIVYFGQKHCAYCKALLEVNFGLEDIVAYTRRYFDVVPIDIWSDREVVDMSGRTLTEKTFAERERTNFTPSLVFYAFDGSEVLRLRGYYPPYKFRAALEYVADAHYIRESFADYLQRADPSLSFEPGDLIEEDLFYRPPYILDRSRFPGQRPLVVFFEQGNCHACEVLHLEQLQSPEILQRLERFETVQLSMHADTPVLTPDGRRLRARDWARELGIFYAPTLVFFDPGGREILRIDSVVRFHRLKNVLDFVLTRAYRTQPYFQRWREEQAGTGAD